MTLVALLAFATLLFGLFKLLRVAYSNIVRPRYILWRQGLLSAPHPRSVVSGSFHTWAQEDPGVVHLRWQEQYGPTFRFVGPMQSAGVMTFDKTALSHVCNDSRVFQKPDSVRTLLTRILGQGLVSAEGSDHARQRKVMNPSFGPAQIKAMYPMVVEKATKLHDVIADKVQDGPINTNMYHHVSNATLDIIGVAGFGYEINALENGRENELVEAFETMFRSFSKLSAIQMITQWFPSLEFLAARDPRTITTRRAQDTMRRIGAQLLEEKKTALRDNNGGKDLLSLLVKANMSEDLKPSARMTEEEVMAQITTFLLAGNDTTGSGLSWALYALSKKPSTQTALRAELANANFSGAPTFDQLNSLEYLDAVVRETLRLYAPASSTIRVATKDTIVPLGQPYVDSKGVKHDRLQVPKNTLFMVPILALNKSTSIWGPDAQEFRPERWLDAEKGQLPDGSMEIPSINFPTFLAGPHACIGFRLSLNEMKILLYTLISSFSFELIEGLDDIKPQKSLASKPSVRSKPEEGPQLPLRVSLIQN